MALSKEIGVLNKLSAGIGRLNLGRLDGLIRDTKEYMDKRITNNVIIKIVKDSLSAEEAKKLDKDYKEVEQKLISFLTSLEQLRQKLK